MYTLANAQCSAPGPYSCVISHLFAETANEWGTRHQARVGTREFAPTRDSVLSRKLLLALRRQLVELTHQRFASSRNRDSAIANNLRSTYLFPVQLLVGVVVRPHRSAAQRNSGKKSFRLGIGEYVDVGVIESARVRAGGTGGGIGIRAELQFAREDLVRTPGVHDQQHVVGGGAAQLHSQAARVQGVHGGSAPSAGHFVAGPAAKHAPSVSQIGR